MTKQIEWTEEISRMKSVFLAGMSHEIRTPVHGIIGFAELALDDDIKPNTKNYLSKIKMSAESLLIIINDILEASKIEAGKIELERIPFNLNDIIKVCHLITFPKAREKGLSLFCYAEPSAKLLAGDPTRLRQVLLNLLSNAVKFTNTGVVKLLAAVTDTSPNSVTIYFEVKDTGIGMTEEQISRIFQPFMQADNSSMLKYGETGLGLLITKNIIELMGSELLVESACGSGSKFSFEVEFETLDSGLTQVPANQNKADEKPVFEGEVLVCEDNMLNQNVILDHLSRVGLKTIIARNGRVGAEKVEERIKNNKKQFDLIFMDINMPEMDGLEAAKRMTEAGCKAPIVALTANAMPEAKEHYIKAGMCDCLSKPFTAYELWSCLLKYLTPIKMILEED